MSALARAGGQWRRTQAQALHDESVSINRIAELYGVTRQRVSALLRDRETADAAAEG
jgi:predicted transcriptional regulator